MRGCRIDVEPRRVERASDHTPVIANFRPERRALYRKPSGAAIVGDTGVTQVTLARKPAFARWSFAHPLPRLVHLVSA